MLLIINVLDIVIPVVILAGLACLFAVLIAVVSKKFAIKEDMRIKQVEDRLAGANCGACGYAGCADLARAIVEGKAKPTACPVTTKAKAHEIADIVGETFDGVEEVLIVACGGGNSCKDKYSYIGYGDCATVELLAGGRKACANGCIGMGKCTDQCAYHAIEVNLNGYAHINEEKCIKCGLCAVACPKNLIKRIPATAVVYVACSNVERGATVKAACDKGCVGCGLCSKTCPEQAITMVNNLPTFDYAKCKGCLKCAEKCPTDAIKIRKIAKINDEE